MRERKRFGARRYLQLGKSLALSPNKTNLRPFKYLVFQGNSQKSAHLVVWDLAVLPGPVCKSIYTQEKQLDPGPFLVMDFLEGMRITSLLKKPQKVMVSISFSRLNSGG